VPPTRAPRIPPGEVTRLLHAWGEGDVEARDRLVPFVYEELRRRAAQHLRHERRAHTLRPTDLVHDTFLRLRSQNAGWQNREQFFGVASRLMRRILVDHARRRAAAKRAGGLRVTLAGVPAAPPPDPDLLDLDAALDELARLDERQVQLVELRYFGGLSIDEAARVLGVSSATVSREWAAAKAWLYARLKRSQAGAPRDAV
jgi:RNA polymerase sigma factor (TIGR02999 family)